MGIDSVAQFATQRLSSLCRLKPGKLAVPARTGAVRVGTQAYDWTIQGFEGGVTIPPRPAR